MVNSEGIHSHPHQLFSLFYHEISHFLVRQIELRQVAKAQERNELVASFLGEEEPVTVLATIFQERFLK